jgi:hypothetical protein
MKKLILLILFIIELVFDGFSQSLIKNDTSFTYYFGLQTKVIDVLPIELSFIMLRENRPSYRFNLGFCSTQLNKVGNSSYQGYIHNNLALSAFYHKQNITAFYLKSGILLTKDLENNKLKYLSLNSVLAFAYQTFSLTTEDRIYGTVKKNYNENTFYNSLELEYQNLYKSGISFGLILGGKLINPSPFTNIIKGLENGSSYSPGMGFGNPIYFNIQVGYHFRFKKKK